MTELWFAHLMIPTGTEPDWDAARAAIAKIELRDIEDNFTFNEWFERLPEDLQDELQASNNTALLMDAVREEIADDLEAIIADIEERRAARIKGHSVTAYLYIDGWDGDASPECDRWLQMMNLDKPLRAAGFDW